MSSRSTACSPSTQGHPTLNTIHIQLLVHFLSKQGTITFQTFLIHTLFANWHVYLQIDYTQSMHTIVIFNYFSSAKQYRRFTRQFTYPLTFSSKWIVCILWIWRCLHYFAFLVFFFQKFAARVALIFFLNIKQLTLFN